MISRPYFHAHFSPWEVPSCGTAVHAQLLTFRLPAHITPRAMPCRLAFAGSDLFTSQFFFGVPDTGDDRLMSLRPASKATALNALGRTVPLLHGGFAVCFPAWSRLQSEFLRFAMACGDFLLLLGPSDDSMS